MSQLKVWKMVKKQRERKATARQEEEQRQEQVELDLGRSLTIGNEQKRAAWEKVYGDQAYFKVPKVDSGVGTGATASPSRASFGVNDSDKVESTGEKATEKAKTQQPPTVTVRVASEDSIYELSSPTAENLLASRSDNAEKSTAGSPDDIFEGPPTSPVSEERTRSETHGPADNTASPSIVPLPFKVQEDSDFLDDSSSIATFAASDRLSSRISKRLSSLSLMQHLAKKSRRQSTLSQAAEAGSVAPHINDRASTMLSNIGISDKGDFERDGLLFEEQPSPPLEHSAEDDPSAEPLMPGASLPLTSQNLRSDSPEVQENTGAKAHERKDNGSVQERSRSRSASRLSSQSIREMNMSRAAGTETADDCTGPMSFQDQLPEGASKVMMTYRTNEWAKHLESAEAPLPEVLRKPSRGPNSAPIMTEGATPVNVQQLRQTAFTAAPTAMRINTDLARSTTPSRDSLPSQQQRQSSLPPKSDLRRSSQGRPMNRISSQNSMQNPRAIRRASAPLTNSPLAGSPIEEGVEMSFPQRSTRTPSGMRPNTLMNQRDSMLQNKHSSTSLTRTSSSNSLGPYPQLQSQTAAYSHPNQRSSHQGRQQASRPQFTPRLSGGYSPYHQPLSGPPPPAANRESTASAWRSSLATDVTKNLLSQQQIEAKRNELLEQKRRTNSATQAAGAEVARRESQRRERTSRGDMMERHKEAMKKLQAGVEL